MSEKLSNFVISCQKPFISSSSFRIDDILVKKDSPIGTSNNILNNFNIENNNDKSKNLSNEPDSSRKMTNPGNLINEIEINPETSFNPSKVMSALNSFYDISCHYPSMNMLINANKQLQQSINQERAESFYKTLNSDTTLAASALDLSRNASVNAPLGFFANLSNAFFPASPSLLASSNKTTDDYNNKFSTTDSTASNKNPVKNSIKLCRRRKARTVFSDQQLSGLEKRFESQKYLSTPERIELANSLGLSETQVSLSLMSLKFSLIKQSTLLITRDLRRKKNSF